MRGRKEDDCLFYGYNSKVIPLFPSILLQSTLLHPLFFLHSSSSTPPPPLLLHSTPPTTPPLFLPLLLLHASFTPSLLLLSSISHPPLLLLLLLVLTADWPEGAFQWSRANWLANERECAPDGKCPYE